jgi:transcriptional regulator with XRE-family HTH domain
MRKNANHTEKRAEFARSIGGRIRLERTRLGISRAYMATNLGFADSASVAGWELGLNTPPAFLLGELAEMLGVSLSYLVMGKD